MTKPKLYSAGLLEWNNDSIKQEKICQLMTLESYEVIRHLLTYRKCFQRGRQRSAREMCQRRKVLFEYIDTKVTKSQSHKVTK